jgi:hypothetical protein
MSNDSAKELESLLDRNNNSGGGAGGDKPGENKGTQASGGMGAGGR